MFPWVRNGHEKLPLTKESLELVLGSLFAYVVAVAEGLVKDDIDRLIRAAVEQDGLAGRDLKTAAASIKSVMEILIPIFGLDEDAMLTHGSRFMVNMIDDDKLSQALTDNIDELRKQDPTAGMLWDVLKDMGVDLTPGGKVKAQVGSEKRPYRAFTRHT